MTNLIKGLVAVGTVGTASGGVYLGRGLFTKNETKSVRQHLLDSGFRLISDLNDKEGVNDQWTEEFKSDKEKIKKLLGIDEDSEVEGGKLLKKWCEYRLKQDYSDTHKDLNGVKNYCLIRTIENQLLRNNKKALNPEDTDNTKWEATYSKRKETKTISPRSQISGLVGQWDDGQDTKASDLPIVKQWCKNKFGGFFIAKEKAVVYTSVENWCTEEGAQVNQAR